jgi:hypothetical protein
MELNELPPKDGAICAYCEICGGPLDLIFAPFRENVSGVEIEMDGLPTLECFACGWRTLPERTRFSIMRAHEIAVKEGNPIFKSQRNIILEDFGFTDVPFNYDPDDFYYYPGLERPWDKGFLTPVYFNRRAIAKFDADPTYLVRYASPTYGDIFGDGFSIAFGINRHGHLIMWLGDIAKLSKPEQYYLMSENRPSDHCLGSEFYDGQIECIFTEPPRETLLFVGRSDFLAAAYKLWGTKLAHLDDVVLDLAGHLKRPVHDTPAQRHAVSDNLNKVHIESLDNDALGKLIVSLGIACRGTRQLKRLQALLESITDSAQTYALMTPFYTLYDFRTSYSHLGSVEGAIETMKSVTDRLGLAEDAGVTDIYDRLLEQMICSYSALTTLVAKPLPAEVKPDGSASIIDT